MWKSLNGLEILNHIVSCRKSRYRTKAFPLGGVIGKFLHRLFGLMIEVDWPTLFKSFYEMVRVKVACKDYKKIPHERLFEMNKNLHVVSFTVEANRENSKDGHYGNGDDGGDNGADDGHKEDDEEFDDLYSTDDNGEKKGSTKSNISVVKTPITKPTKYGAKTVCGPLDTGDLFDQEQQLRELMEGNSNMTCGDMMSPIHISQPCIDASLRSGVLTPNYIGKGKELELPHKELQCGDSSLSKIQEIPSHKPHQKEVVQLQHKVDKVFENPRLKDTWETPVQEFGMQSDCYCV